MLKNNVSLKEALYHTILNEMVNIIITDKISKDDWYKDIPLNDRDTFIVSESEDCKEETDEFYKHHRDLEIARNAVLDKRKKFLSRWLKQNNTNGNLK